jgi:hypothetical protein
VFDISRMPASLKQYWLAGAGAAKIRWGAGGDFDRCVTAINAEITKHGRKPLPDHEIKGLCANLHREATGATPGNAPGERHHSIDDPTARMAELIAEFAQRFVRNADYWGKPVGTPIKPGMKPKRGKGHEYRPAKHRGIEGWENPPTTPARADDAHVLANIIHQQGWTGPMDELDDDAFDRFAADSPAVVYRGLTGFLDRTGGKRTPRSAEELHRQFIDEDDPFIGSGHYGYGWYTSDKVDRANEYAGESSTGKGDRSAVGRSVMEMAVRPEARILDLTGPDVKNSDRRDDLGQYAAQLGYDGVKLSGTTPRESYYLLLNRSAVVVRRMRQ